VLQAITYCTPERAKKYVISLAAASAVITTIIFVVHYLTHQRMLFDIFAVLYTLMAAAVLAVNLAIMREVGQLHATQNVAERTHEAHHPSNYAVPNKMLLTNAFVFVALSLLSSLIYMLYFWVLPPPSGAGQWVDTRLVRNFAIMFKIMIFVYNFFVYLITGRHFRSELHYLFCGKFNPGRPASVAEGARLSRSNA